MKFRLATVLRARQAQEDVAKAATARAEHEAETATRRVRSAEHNLDEQDLPRTGTVAAYAAAIWARRALAEALGDAITAADDAEDARRERAEELAAAAIRRRALEQLAERHAAARRRAEESADRAVLDEIAGMRRHRKRGK